jgi:NhaA family Na+:H+ antiporter
VSEFEHAIPLKGDLTTEEQHEIIQDIKSLCKDAETPLQKLENNLHPWVAFIIMPLFALANAGMVVNGNFFSSLMNPVSIGVITGLILGKFIGVFSFTWLMVRFKVAELPEKANWTHVIGVSVLAGVGFTMSLFVTGLAFSDMEIIDQSKYGILTASVVCGVAGVFILKRTR